MSQIDNSREIWRGKHKESGVWVYGDHTVFTMSGKQISNVYLVCGDAYYLVLYSTIGKCTGSSNKNGKPIFEDDMVKCKDGIGVIEWDDYASQFVIRFENSTVRFDDYKALGVEMEIAGNTFDGEYTEQTGCAKGCNNE